MEERRALVIGVDDYDNFDGLTCACNDASAIASMLARNDDGSINYRVRKYVSAERKITRSFIREAWLDLFQDFDGDALFYFSGHGATTEWGAQLVAQDGDESELGPPMEDLLLLANNSSARDVVLIVDCCHSGAMGNPPILQGIDRPLSLLRDNVTILAASRPNEPAYEVDGHGMFTHALIEGLEGGSADLLGNVTPASLFLYAERLFDAWNQRPVYKSHASRVATLRSCKPPVEIENLRRLTDFFHETTSEFPLDPDYESDPEVDDDSPTRHKKREDSRLLKRLRDARLVETCDGKDFFFCALESGSIRMTTLGRYYWRLLRTDKL